LKIGEKINDKNDNPRLCGGTFFVLVLQALKQRVKARQHYKGRGTASLIRKF
jgi:hypothetical protein